MPIYPALNLVFIHVPKTAGGAIEDLLEPHKAPGKKTFANRVLRNIPLKRDIMRAYIPGHATALQHRTWMGDTLWDSYTSFTVVRNPYDRLISAYEFERQTPRHHRHARVKSMSFTEYVRSRSNAQTTMLCDREGQLMVDQIVRFENLHEELETFFKAAGVKERLPRHGTRNTSEKEPRATYLTDEALASINAACARDFDLLGYRMIS